MAQSVLAIRPPRFGLSGNEGLAKLSDVRSTADRIHLYWPPETIGMRTPFRTAAVNFIYHTALDLLKGRLKSAEISVWSHPGEENSLTLNLDMIVDLDWGSIKEPRYEIHKRLGEWLQRWSPEQKDDFARRIYFGLFPTDL